MTDKEIGLSGAYKITNPDEAREFYQGWAGATTPRSPKTNISPPNDAPRR